VRAPPVARTLVAIATYNERENLAPLVQAILAHRIPDLGILVVDDASPDGTGQLADQLAAEHPQVAVLHRHGKLGLGTAHVAAMRFAAERGCDHLLTMDADFSHDPRYLPDLLARKDTCDLVIGSRYVPGGGVRNWGLARRLMSWGANTYVRLGLGLKPRDSSGAYRCYRVSTLRRVDLEGVVATGYAFQEEILYRLQLLGARIEEVPILFEDRRRGQTKMSLREIAGLFLTVLRLRWRRLAGRIPSAPPPPPDHEPPASP